MKDNKDNVYKEDLAKKYISRNKDIPKFLNNEEIDKLMFLANEAISKTNYDEALGCFDKIIDKYNYFDAYNKKGNLLIELNLFDDAINCFNQSFNLTKNNYDAHIGKAFALAELFKLNIQKDTRLKLDILSNLNIACKINNEGFYIKSQILRDLGDYRDALYALNRYVKDNGDKIKKDEKAYFSLFAYKGELYYLLKDYGRAFYTIHTALRFYDNNISALMYMGFLAPVYNKYDYALKCFDKVFDIDNTIYDAMIFKGELLTSLHRYEEAIACFDKCPSEFISNDYVKLINHAKSQIQSFKGTNFFGVTKISNGDYRYVYTFIQNGFRRIYAKDLEELYSKLSNLDLQFKEIHYRKDFTMWDHFYIYYNLPNFPYKYRELISSFLTNDFLEKVDKDLVNLDDLLESKEIGEQTIIKYIVNRFKKKLRYARNNKPSGYYGVVSSIGEYNWAYVDLFKADYSGWNVIHANNLEELENLVKDKNSLWYVYDENLAKESLKRDNFNF